MHLEKPTLVILAAGMGSRYGGLKQLDSFSPAGDTIIDFSIYDALEAGFGKFVFIIRRSFEKEFKAIFDEKLKGKAEVAYVYQEIDKAPMQYAHPEREKPWGTGHALLMAKDVVNENFAIINADDFYGKEAFVAMAKSLSKLDPSSFNFNMIAYKLGNTISEYGSVSRGECQVNKEGYLTSVVERTSIETENGSIFRTNEDGSKTPMNADTIVSMNFWGFTPKCFEYSETLFESFMKEHGKELKSEFFIPLIVNEVLNTNLGTVEVLTSDAKWFGVTYQEDKKYVQREIEKLLENKVYPKTLWE